MHQPDPDVLLYLHNNPPEQLNTVVAPLAAALREHWHGEVVVSDIFAVRVWLGPTERVVIGDRTVLPVRTYARIFRTAYGTALTRCLSRLGSRVVNSPDAVAVAVNKFETAAVLTAAGLPVPAQVMFAGNPTAAVLSEQAELGWPRVLKADQGMGGAAVWKLHDDTQLRAHTVDGRQVRPWVAQQFRGDALGRDIRVVVAGGRVAGGMERRAAPGDFRANITQGGTAYPVELTDLEVDLALRATEALGLVVSGVDMLRTDDGPLVIEVNPNPGLYSLVDGHDQLHSQVAAAIVHG